MSHQAAPQAGPKVARGGATAGPGQESLAPCTHQAGPEVAHGGATVGPVHESLCVRAYRIQTARLTIRCLQPSDAPRIVEAIHSSLDHLRAWMEWALKEPQSIDAKLALILRQRSKFDSGLDFSYAIYDRDEATFLGMIGGHNRIGVGAREIGYWIRSSHVRQGLMTEAVVALTRSGFEIDKLRLIEIQCDPTNLASSGIPRTLGFAETVTIRNRVLSPDGPVRDTQIWTLKAADYPASRSAQMEFQPFDALGRPTPSPLQGEGRGEG